MIRNILYKYTPTEEKYIERRNKGKHGKINIVGYKGSHEEDFKRIYYQSNKKIQYNIYMNDNNVIIAQLKVEGFGQKHYIKYISNGDLFKAEYKAKLFVLKTTRKIFKNNDIC